MTHAPSDHGILHADHQTAPSTVEEMYFRTLDQARGHLIQTLGIERAQALTAEYGDRLIQAIVQWRGKQIADGTMYSRDAEGNLQVAGLPVASFTMTLDAERKAAGQASVRGFTAQGHAGHAERTQGPRGQGQ